MDIPWISITGVRTIEDIYIIDRAIKNTNTNIPTICNFCGSYKRLKDFSIEGEHSCSIHQLVDIGSHMPKSFKGKIGLHFSPNVNGCFCDDCVEYVNLMQKYFEIVQLTIVSLWPDLKELALLKSKLKIDLIVQIPLYKIKHIDSAEIRQRILSYVDIATAFIFDTYGVKVIVEAEYNYEFLQQLDVEYGMFEIMEQFQKYDISFVVESKLSCGGEVLITKCGNRMAIQEKKIFFGGININNPLFYIDDFRPYFTSVIYYNLVLLRNVFMIHSASYSMNGKGYMIIGDSGCGKSSLTLANILSGGKYLSNDITYLGEKEDKIKIWGLPQVMNLGDLALEWFLREMEKEFWRFCKVESEYRYNKKPKTCISLNKEKIENLEEDLKYIIFPEKDLNADEPRYEFIDISCAFPKILSQIKTFDKPGFRKGIDTKIYLSNLEKLFNKMESKITFVVFYWTKNHKKNIDVLKKICTD